MFTNKFYFLHARTITSLWTCCALLICLDANSDVIDTSEVCTDENHFVQVIVNLGSYANLGSPGSYETDQDDLQKVFHKHFEFNGSSKDFRPKITGDDKNEARKAFKALPEIVSAIPLTYVPDTYVFKLRTSARRTNIDKRSSAWKTFLARIFKGRTFASRLEAVFNSGSGGEKKVKVKAEFSSILHANNTLPNDFHVQSNLPTPNDCVFLGGSAPPIPWSCYSSDARRQWNLVSAAGIHAATAWERVALLTAQPAPVVVAVMDTGVGGRTAAGVPISTNELYDAVLDSMSRDLLTGNLATNLDKDGHGTAIASIIAARTNNEPNPGSSSIDDYANGIAGITWGGKDRRNLAKIMPIRIMETTAIFPYDDRVGCSHDLLDALAYAVDPTSQLDRGYFNLQLVDGEVATTPMPAIGTVPNSSASVINLSASIRNNSKFIEQELKNLAAYFPGTLVVNGPANYSGNLDSVQDYPARYELENVLTVAATNEAMDIRSTYGPNSIEILAPGDYIHAVRSDNGEIDYNFSGNSFAAPQVAGAAVLLKALSPENWGYKELKAYLMKSASRRMCNQTPKPNICVSTKIASDRGLLDLDRATAPPLAITNVEGLYSGQAGTKVWRSQDVPSIKWERAFTATVDSGSGTRELCSTVDIDLQLTTTPLQPAGSASNESWRSIGVAVPVSNLEFCGNSQCGSSGSGISFPTQLPANSTITGRFRLQCTGSHMFRMSEPFTVEAP